MGFHGCIRAKVIVIQNIPTVTELLRCENTSMAVLFLIESTAILVFFFDSAAADRCSTLLSDVNEQPAGEADRWCHWAGRRPQTPGACPIRSCSSGTLGIFGCRITVYRFMRKHERVNRYAVVFDNILTFNSFYGIVMVRSNMLVWARVNS